MKGTTLRALGLNIGDVDARVLLDEGFDCSGYGLTKAGTRKLALLRTFINEYREDLSKEPGKCIKNSSDAAALMADSLRGLDHEELWVAFLPAVETRVQHPHPHDVLEETDRPVDSELVGKVQLPRRRG